MSSPHPIRRVLRKAAAASIGATLAIGISLTIATPAAASGSYTGMAYVYGSGAVSDDFDDEGVVNVSTHRYSNVACLWQAILWANGYLPSSGIDGIFGDQTDAATRSFQRDNNLVADGSAGRNSWNRAGDQIWQYANDNGWLYVLFDGRSNDFVMQRAPDGNYRFYPPNKSGVYGATYNSRTC